VYWRTMLDKVGLGIFVVVKNVREASRLPPTGKGFNWKRGGRPMRVDVINGGTSE